MIKVKGSAKGLYITLNDTDFTGAKEEIKKEFEKTKNFYKNASLEVYLTSNTLSEAEVNSLFSLLCDILNESQLNFLQEAPKVFAKQHDIEDTLFDDEEIVKTISHVAEGESLQVKHSALVLGDVCGDISCGDNLYVFGRITGTVSVGNKNGDCAVIKSALGIISKEVTIFHKTVKIHPKRLFGKRVCTVKTENGRIKQSRL